MNLYEFALICAISHDFGTNSKDFAPLCPNLYNSIIIVYDFGRWGSGVRTPGGADLQFLHEFVPICSNLLDFVQF